MRKILLITIIHCFFLQTSYASSTKYGYGDLNLSNFVVNAFIRYVKGGHTKAPYLFAVSADGKQSQSYTRRDLSRTI